MIHAGSSVDLNTIGLLLPDLTRDDVRGGDLIVGPDRADGHPAISRAEPAIRGTPGTD